MISNAEGKIEPLDKTKKGSNDIGNKDKIRTPNAEDTETTGSDRSTLVKTSRGIKPVREDERIAKRSLKHRYSHLKRSTIKRVCIQRYTNSTRGEAKENC